MGSLWGQTSMGNTKMQAQTESSPRFIEVTGARMTRLLIRVGVFLVAAHASAQVAVPKGYSMGDIIVIDPVLCQVTEFVLPEPIPTICQKFTELGPVERLS